MASREPVIACQKVAAARTPVRAAEALLEFVVSAVVGAGLILGLAPHLVAAVDARGDEAGVG